jgi:hypothetical protein
VSGIKEKKLLVFVLEAGDEMDRNFVLARQLEKNMHRHSLVVLVWREIESLKRGI